MNQASQNAGKATYSPNSKTPSKGHLSRHRRGRSETLQAQHINLKDVRFGSYLILDLFIVLGNMMSYLYLIMVGRVTVGTWIVVGRIPLEDL
ncbi:type I inositol 1,4,5-trisphosphate 5-phosphatase 2-like protein [Cinnamomum micranthum f. kanehirae]|uniref:Type I inositol 1,4,5-trisphosphate 5-phosphatase 2-like protein n=1 Tax=Cinnamomum micranthum f. kanehirae TaxID=337451 RepID=A0A3S3NK29_9MAGN|nr:type I inositol 1,4,5-trisphosphate 5-phosphatase 2-like protein [Cinnamomum micranthum f. kanehirae]